MSSKSIVERTCYCGLVDETHVGKTVSVMGWVDRRRDLGNLIFLEVRDREGVVQVVVHPDQPEAMSMAKQLRSEFVISATGEVIFRDPETVNPRLNTGALEIRAERIVLLNESETPPFQIKDSSDASEETRLRYRFLDLRSKRLQENLRLRHRAVRTIRDYLDGEGFLEIETPFLTKSTPEGARDYLVPSRLYPGSFYALPQSPQLFKQILMVSGFDRYFQVVRCFRDEDLRADRQPEFTQVDIELSFPGPDSIFRLVEGLLVRLFTLIGETIETPFKQLTYQEAMSRYGSDRPDTRFGLELIELTDIFVSTEFRVFQEIAAQDEGLIAGIRVPGAAPYTRKDLANLEEFVKKEGVSGLAWIRRTAKGIKNSLPKVVESELIQSAIQRTGLEQGDLALIVAGPTQRVRLALGALRLEVARRETLIPKGRLDFLWVHDFPLFEWEARERRFTTCHHPFTAPRREDEHLLSSDPGQVRARAYDIVLNGTEIGGGSFRIHKAEMQEKIFDALQIDREEAQARFGFFLDALRYGAPPHGGIALGLDRIVMILAGERSLREVIAFPKTARAMDLMCGAPSSVRTGQLLELGLTLTHHDDD